VVDEEVCDALATIGNTVVVEVGGAGSDFAQVAHAITVAVGLRWVREGGAVVCGVRSTVAVGVERHDDDGVPTSACDA